MWPCMASRKSEAIMTKTTDASFRWHLALSTAGKIYPVVHIKASFHTLDATRASCNVKWRHAKVILS